MRTCLNKRKCWQDKPPVLTHKGSQRSGDAHQRFPLPTRSGGFTCASLQLRSHGSQSEDLSPSQECNVTQPARRRTCAEKPPHKNTASPPTLWSQTSNMHVCPQRLHLHLRTLWWYTLFTLTYGANAHMQRSLKALPRNTFRKQCFGNYKAKVKRQQ